MNRLRSVLHLALTLALLLAGHAAKALGRDVPYEEFATADGVVELLQCGQWKAPEGDGFYRVIRGENYAQSFLYVQRMQQSGPQGSIRAVDTLGIAQLNNDHADLELSALRCQARAGGGIRLTAQVASGHDNRRYRVRIDVGPMPGHYVYRELNRR